VGRRSPRRAPQEELERMLGLYRDKYADFTVKHFHGIIDCNSKSNIIL
jgi:hypothetical protein